MVIAGSDARHVAGADLLVVAADDDADIRALIVDKLANAGLRVIAVGDGASALIVLRDRRPSLAILDVSMPGLTGLEVTRAIKSDARTAHIAVMLLSALSSAEDRWRGREAGADDYLSKPFSPRELLDRVHRLLSPTPIG
ncbi:MAG TPA: response regulator [Jatrophihabitantaceae bacterium]|jgi:DNA-binding response OmpR family regulator|nr:response regulator [Jatrophihabitantaceae bacterium]